MDAARVRMTEVFEMVWTVARTHPDAAVRTEFGEALVGLWASSEAAHDMLQQVAGDDVVH